MQRIICSLFLLFHCIGLYSQVNLSSGLVAYFPFNGNSLDASGNGNNAANFGATLTTDQWGNPNSAYSFNGFSNYMKVNNSSSIQPSSFTICARVKPTGFYNGPCFNNVIVAKGNSAGYANGDFALTYTPSLNQNPVTYCSIQDSLHESYRVYAGSTGAANSLSCITPVNAIPYVVTNNWDCVIGLYDSATHTGTIYVNGVFRYSYTTPIAMGTNTADMYIGKQNTAGYEYWMNATLDEVRIYNRALNIQEIDSVCNLVPEKVINQYAAVQAYHPCQNSYDVDTASFFAPGDTVILIQMKGSEIDTSNTASFGNMLNYHNCGNYEFNIVQSVVGSTVYLLNALTRSYDIPSGNVQLVTVPSYVNYTVNTPHTCMPWNGVKGGVFVMNVLGSLDIVSNINVSGKGFRGGISNIINSTVYGCNNFQFYDAPNIDQSAAKGEGITNVSINKSFARGKLGNGGGGGNGHNGGGGGGSNANVGGNGGSQHDGCNPSALPNTTGGLGGLQLNYSLAANKIFLGGGGGAGQSNNYYTSFPAYNNYTSNGAPGGGIVIINANNMNALGGSIVSNGDNGYVCDNTGVAGICHDGMGGGGAGGTVLLSTLNVTGTLNVSCKGGDGGNMSASSGQGLLGPGGGGSGGTIWCSGATMPIGIIGNTSFGINGVCLNYGNDAWGAEPGQSGILLSNLILPIDTTLHINSIAVNAGTDQTICQGGSIQLQASGASTYSWTPTSTLNNTTISNPIANPNSTTTYTVVGTDASGCSGSDMVIVNVYPSPNINCVANPSTICIGSSTTLTASGGINYAWSNGITNGVPFVPTTTTTYTVTGTDANGCSNTSTVTVTIGNGLILSILPTNPILCVGDSVQLIASGATNYTWQPAIYMNSNTISNPIVYPPTTTTYTVSGSDALGCSGTGSITIEIETNPTIKASSSGNVECNNHTIQLSATGATTYSWSPATFLSSPNSAITNAVVNTPTIFVVTGAIGSCIVMDSVFVDVFNNDESSIFIPNAFSPNGDGNNDCIRIVNEANFLSFYFAIYNRWGERVFESDNPDICWEGNYKTQPAEQGVYYYYLKADTKCGKIFRKGDLTLIR